MLTVRRITARVTGRDRWPFGPHGRNAPCLTFTNVRSPSLSNGYESMALSAAQLKHFEKRLQEERTALQRELLRYTGAEAADDEQEQSGDLTKVPYHPADLGTDTINQEIQASNATRESHSRPGSPD